MSQFPSPERRAAIDVGSNSVVLAVCERDGDLWPPIDDASTVTALGEGTKATGVLKPEAIERTLAAIRTQADRAVSLGARTVVAGTMAFRIARNAEEFERGAEAQGTPIAILSGDEEAALGTRAILADPKYGGSEDLAIIDLGGQSTELTLLHGGETRFAVSLPIGTLGVRDRLLGPETNDAPTLLRAAIALDGEIAAHYERTAFPFPTGAPVVALGSGATTLVVLREGMTEWDAARVDGAALEYEEVGRAVGFLNGLDVAARMTHLPTQPALARTLHVSALILERILYALRAEGCRVSVRGWRHGLIADDARFLGMNASR